MEHSPRDIASTTPFAVALADGVLRQGLSVVTYSGGDDFSVAPAVVHLVHAAFAPSPELRARVSAAAHKLLLAEAADAFMQEWKGLPAADCVNWDAAEWSRELVITGAPPTACGYVNLYYHGLLFSSGVEEEMAMAHPLVALLEPCGSLAYRSAADPSALPADASFQAAEQHVHDCLTLGSDTARAELTTGRGAGAGVVLCVDLRAAARPRVRVSDLIVLPTPRELEAVAAAVGALGADAPCELAEVMQRALAAAPTLREVLEAAALHHFFWPRSREVAAASPAAASRAEWR